MVRVLERAGWHLEALSEPRYWDPDPVREVRARRTERLKFVARAGLYPTVIRPGLRFPALQAIPGRISGGRVSWDRLFYSIGDQPVLGDVLFVVARPG